MIINHARLLGKCKCTYDVSTYSVVADNQNIIIAIGSFEVNHAAAELLSVGPDHLGVVTGAVVEPGDNRVRLLSVI